MPQLVCTGGGESKSKVACETAAALPLEGSDAAVQCGAVRAGARADDADAPAESVLLRVRDGLGLVELFGAALRRDGSTKGCSNPKAAAAARNQGALREPGSRRLPAGKPAVVIGVLPAGKVVAQERRAPGRIVARGWRRPAAGARVFASEVAVGAAEPVSPKVSCFGAVRSEKPSATNAPPGKEQDEEPSGCCWASVRAALFSCNISPREGEPEASEPNSEASTPESPPGAVLSPPRPVMGLGDVKRLASRRWAETIAGEGRGSV